MSLKSKPESVAKTAPKAKTPPTEMKAVPNEVASPDSFDELLDRLASYLSGKSQSCSKDIATIKELLRQVEAGSTSKVSPQRAVRPAQGRKSSMGKDASKSGSTLVVDRPLPAGLKSLLESVLDQPGKWMDTPNRQFGGRKPSELVGTADEARIFDLLHAVDQGLF